MPAPRNATKPHSRVHRGAAGAVRPIVQLPAEGCSLPAPKIPVGRTWTRAERARWRELWASPQACRWDETAKGTVAALVVYEVAILEGTASAWQAQEARYAAEALGLTPRALASLGWSIE
jgi:hypothetical protein